MGKLYLLISALLIAVGQTLASTPSGYEWWIDNDMSSVHTGSVSGEQFDIQIDLSDLPKGTHYFNCRLNTADGEWGSVYRKMFYSVDNTVGAVSYEYWIDDNYSAKVEGNVSQGANVYTVDTAGVGKGLHRFNYRLCTDSGEWGSVYSKYFFYTPTQSPFTTYEYWFDNDYANRKTVDTDTNPVTFDIDLTGFDMNGKGHYFNLRARDKDGNWGSVYRKLIVSYNNDSNASVIGYRHYFNGVSLGYVPVERKVTDSYTFDFDIPDSLGFKMRNLTPTFEANKVSVLGNDSIHYILQIQTERGWAPPTNYDFEATTGFSTDAVEMAINSSHSFTKPGRLEFAAVKFTSTGEPLYFRSDSPIALDLYRDGEKVEEIAATDLAEMTTLTFEAGEYFGVLRDAEYEGNGEFTFHLMDTPNMVPTPKIEFANGIVTITCSREGAEIYYTLDDSTPTVESTKYTEPFALDHNAVVKAMAIVPGSDIAPSAIGELVVDSYVVSDPQIKFENLMVVITQEQREGVQTYYTLDGKEPIPGEANTNLYGAPFSLTGSVKVLARSFKEGYTPSGIVEFAYNHSVYITAPPTFNVDGNTVTLTATTEGSDLYYSIGDPDPDAMVAYEAPFEMFGNGTIYAQARKGGMYDSEVVSYEVNGKKMGKPQMAYDAHTHVVTITAPNSSAEVYYTLDESAPVPGNETTMLYDAPFEFDRNGVVKAIAIDPSGNLDPSDIAELVIDENKVDEPRIRFENLMVVITQEQREGVQTYYTLDGKEPVPGEANTNLYSAPFSLTGSVKVLARSFKEGYNPSAVVEFAYNHSVYVTLPPTFSVEGNVVTLTAVTEGSDIYYSIGDPDPDAMSLYESPFEMSGNGIIYAQARMSGMYDSEVVNHEVNGKKMGKPQMAYDAQTHVVTITAPNSSAEVYYTLDESAPAPGSENTMLYDAPFEFDRNGVVKAIAIDPTGNLDPSDIAERVIDENIVKDPHISFENLMVVITQEQLPGVQTYYTLDGKEPVPGEANTNLYSAPFSLTGSVKVLARSFKEGYNPSAVVEFAYDHSAYITAPPTFSVEDNIVTLTATTKGSDIYYSIGNPDPDAMSLYEGPFTVSGNMTVYAQARKSGMYDSEVVSHAMIGQKTMMPYGNFDSATRLLTLHCDTEGAVISYSYSADGDWEVYSSPILIEGNRTVYAKASAADYLDSDIAEIIISDFKCADARISYNGRYVTLSTDESDAEIRYTLNGENPANGTVYSGTFDAEGIGTVKAVVVKAGYMNSDIEEYAIRGYADEEHAETSAEGILARCYEWAGRDWLDGVDRLRIEGRLNGDDYSLLREMKSLRHLDLTDVENATLPDAVFASTKLVSVVMPKQLTDYGTAIFNGNDNLCAIVWNSAEMKAENRLTEGVANPNLLLYLPYADATNLSALRNKIELGKAAEIVLTDGYPYYAPLDFTADRISYTRSFSKQTQIGICAGWETLTLPFDVEEIKDALGEVKPFEVAGDDDRPFWLYCPDGTGWAKTGTIRAHEPYLISMPNNPDYVEEYNIRGDVTFSATGASVAATPMPVGFSYKGTTEMWSNYSRLAADNTLWVVNDDWSEGNAPGSVFEKGLRDVRPFECYLTSDVAKRRMPIFDSSEVDEVMSELGTKIWCENHDLCIMSGISQRIRIYDTVGQMVRVAEVRAGEICRVHDLAPGIYLIGHTKYMVR